jgi:hypothetical protein
MKRLLVALLLLLVPACAAFTVAAQEHGTRGFVHSISNDGGIYCSAVVLAPGLALTAAHCADPQYSSITIDGFVGQVVARGDDRLDVAVISVPVACPCVRLAEYEAQVDEPVYVVGFPRGIAQVLTFGTSQGVHNNGRMPYGRRLVTTALVAGGNSGGGVFVFRDGEFQLVGVLVEQINHLSFAVPLIDIRPFLRNASLESAMLMLGNDIAEFSRAVDELREQVDGDDPLI